MAINEPLLLPGGAMLLNSGKMVEDPEDCCCNIGSEDECNYCDKTPVSISVLFSGLAVCTTCWDDGGFSGPGYKYTIVPTAPIGPFTLTQDAVDNCKYNYVDLNGTGVITVYNDFLVGPCEGTIDNTLLFEELAISACIQPGGGIIVAATWRAVSAGRASFIFGGTTSGTSACALWGSISNDRTDCDVMPAIANTCVGRNPQLKWRGCKDGAATATPIWG